MDGTPQALAFWVLAAVTLIAAGGVLASRNLLHAVLFLILAFVGVAGFFALLSAPFLAMAQVVIYVGAISVLVLFAVLLTPRASRDNSESSMLVPAVVLAGMIFAIMALAIFDTNWSTVSETPIITAEDLGSALLSTWVLPFQIASVLLTAAMVGAIMLVRSSEEEAEDERV